jgi:hypothetical protein
MFYQDYISIFLKTIEVQMLRGIQGDYIHLLRTFKELQKITLICTVLRKTFWETWTRRRRSKKYFDLFFSRLQLNSGTSTLRVPLVK